MLEYSSHDLNFVVINTTFGWLAESLSRQPAATTASAKSREGVIRLPMWPPFRSEYTNGGRAQTPTNALNPATNLSVVAPPGQDAYLVAKMLPSVSGLLTNRPEYR